MGCTLDDAPLDDAPLHERLGDAEIDGVLAQVCDRKVHIARRPPDTSCGSGPLWEGAQLFDVGTPWLAAEHHDAIEPALARYCRYTWKGTGEPTAQQVDDLYTNIGDPIGPSCRAIRPQGDVLTTALGETLRALFHFNTGRPSASDLGLPETGTPEPRVSVAVIDTQSSDLSPPRSLHGRHMGNIIADIACPDDDPECRVEVQYVVGLPRIAGGGVDYQNGGRVATFEDVALAIYEAIERWELANTTRAVPSRLVLSLSLAWEPLVFGGDEQNPAPAIKAIRTVLEIASCKDVLIVASAGNHGDYCDATGPMGPAFWETRPAPDQERCGELGIYIDPPGNGYRPLVHAAGGLDLEGGPLPNARVGANPRLMAAAAHVVAGEPLHGGLTGTSVATAVTSGAAALVWSHRPNLRAAAVMSWVYGGGKPLSGLTTDFGLGPDPMAPHRVDACAALQAACAPAGANCPEMPLACLVEDSHEKSDLVDDLTAVLPGEVIERSMPDVDQCVDSCGALVDVHVGAGASASCDAFAVDPTEALVNPTPGSIGCPTCAIHNGTLILSTHSDFDGVGIDNVTVHLQDDQGTWHPYELGAMDLTSTTVTSSPIPASQLPAGTIKAGTITIKFSNGVTTKDTLLVL